MKGNLHDILQARTKPAQPRNSRALERSRKKELQALVREFKALKSSAPCPCRACSRPFFPKTLHEPQA